MGSLPKAISVQLSLAGILIVLVLRPSYAWTDDKVVRENPIKTIEDAYSATKESIRSGTGSGVYEVYVRPAQGKELALVVKAKVKTIVDPENWTTS